LEFSDRKAQSQYLSDADRLLGLLSELLVGRNLNTCEGKKQPNVNISSTKQHERIPQKAVRSMMVRSSFAVRKQENELGFGL
jgi:hypothetical protein